MTSGEITSVVTVLGSILTILGITGIDPSLLTNAVNGIVAVVTLAAAVWTWWMHRKAIKAIQ